MRKMSDIVRNQDPVTLPPNASVREACQRMRDRRVGAVLVTEGDCRLVGIFTGKTLSTVYWPRERAPLAPLWRRS
jgi:CBS domain-containing protein